MTDATVPGYTYANALGWQPTAGSTATTTTAAGDGLTAAEETQYQSASASLTQFMKTIPGLGQLDPEGALAAWVNSTAFHLAGQGTTSGDIWTQIQATMNNPAANPANLPPAYAADAQRVFDQLFPGYNEKIAAGTTNANGQYTGLAGYINYAAQVQQYANTAGLVPGSISRQDIGKLWASDVSSDEVSTRLTTDYANAMNAWNNIPGFAEAMQAQGMTSVNQLASYYINPQNTLKQINQQISAGQLGAEAGTSGFGELSAAKASALSAFLTNSGSTQLTTQEANQAFTGALGAGVQGSAAQLAAGGYEQTAPGQSTTGTIGQDVLLAGIEGNATALQQTEHAQEARTAGSKGGGGAATTAAGASGLGFAQQ